MNYPDIAALKDLDDHFATYECVCCERCFPQTMMVETYEGFLCMDCIEEQRVGGLYE